MDAENKSLSILHFDVFHESLCMKTIITYEYYVIVSYTVIFGIPRFLVGPLDCHPHIVTIAL